MSEEQEPREVLLAERGASLWVLVELFEALTSASYFFRATSTTARPSPTSSRC
jgi:hypothetical protein